MPYRVFVVLLALVITVACSRGGDEAVSFNADVRPILNAKCIGCHGGVKQAGGIGFVFRENALARARSGEYAIVPGRPAESAMITRARHDNPELRMPFEAPPLSEAEIELLERWIDEGAKWEQHWAYYPPAMPPIPDAGEGWANGDIDKIVAASHGERGLQNAPEADPQVLLRRVSFDLTGLPPSPALAEAFLGGGVTYEALVDSLLAAPTYGEHFAAKWLELARYADTRGLEKDRERTIWKYRDWVIDAYNEDKPFDRFSTEQLAGDLLPEPTESQLIATAFHRNTMNNDEGGTNNEEYRVLSVIDRVNTTYEVWQATTVGCVQCHSHPYDPIVHEEFYTSYALWNNSADRDLPNEAPVLRTLTTEDQGKYKKLEAWIDEHATANAEVQRRAWSKMVHLHEPRFYPDHFTDIKGGLFNNRGDDDYLAVSNGGSFLTPTVNLTDVMGVQLNYRVYGPSTVSIHLDGPDGERLARRRFTDPVWSAEVRLPLLPAEGNHRLYVSVSGEGDGHLFGFLDLGVEPPLPGGRAVPGSDEIIAYIKDLAAAQPNFTTPVMVESTEDTRRKSYLFERGNWLVHGKEVTGGVPALLQPEVNLDVSDRLDFAHWLFNPEQPLTARVAVNRIWAGIFGNGLVATLEDFGSQSATNHHPELLDYLAVRFSTDLGWSQKDLLRLIVTSATYRQSSRANTEQLNADPANDYLARGPRRRLRAEEIRDQALAVSRLLSKKMYGPGVMPPQPEGLWGNIPYSGSTWVTSTGEDRYRRAVYTYLRRSVIHPQLTTFDGSNRELCLSRRTPTNTPMQALMTLNDPAYVEAARTLAVQTQAYADMEEKIEHLFQSLLLRSASKEETAVLAQLYAEAQTSYLELPEDEAALEAMTIVAGAVLNLDEALTLS